MENLFTKKVPLYYETEESQLILGDSFKILTKMEPESMDMIFADPPYFLSNDGIGAGRLQDNQQHNMAENKSTTKLSVSMLHTFYGNHFMGKEE